MTESSRSLGYFGQAYPIGKNFVQLISQSFE